ncbi:hypothetical protein [Emticicia sp. 17c]|uniref:hypothetical protein n=1 Tax=Emticicia sp. 17c TaxID=3127704 RepID=UPI00301C57A7
MAKLITIGLSKIEIGDIATDKGMGTELAVIGQTAEGSCTIETAEPEVTEFYVEESDSPVHTALKAGLTTITFQLAAPDLQQCVDVFGGAITGTGTAATWNYPGNAVNLEKSVKITPKEGIVFRIPRGKITARFTGQFGRADTLKVEVSITVLQPEKAGTPPMILSLVAGEGA